MWTDFLTWHLILPAVIGFVAGKWNRGCSFPGLLIAVALGLSAAFTTDAPWWVSLARGLIAAGVFGVAWQLGYQVLTDKVKGESRSFSAMNSALAIPMAAFAMLVSLAFGLFFFLVTGVELVMRSVRRRNRS